MRIVDCHVHFWDPANTDWYPYLSGGQQLNMGDTTGMNRRFDGPTYAKEAVGWNVEKLVNVAAATGKHSIDETLAIDARGFAAGIIGGLPPADSVEESIGFIDAQMAAGAFRGVRPMGQFKEPLPAPEVLRALQDRNLVFELMARTDALAAAAQGLAGHTDLTVVVEHAGWPRAAADFEEWKTGIDALAAVGPNVVCKISGLAMPLGAMSVDAFRPWVEHVIGAFGVDRCMVASNFPVDGLHGSLRHLWSVYDELTSELGDDAQEKLFAANAERVYRF